MTKRKRVNPVSVAAALHAPVDAAPRPVGLPLIVTDTLRDVQEASQDPENPNHDELPALIKTMQAQCAAARRGDLSKAAGTLAAQAHTLDQVFYTLMRTAMPYVGKDRHNFETYFRLALKAQVQARTTLEAVAAIHNPYTLAVVHQANIANGPQQINNGTAPETKNQQNKLLRGRE